MNDSQRLDAGFDARVLRIRPNLPLSPSDLFVPDDFLEGTVVRKQAAWTKMLVNMLQMSSFIMSLS